MPRRPTDEGTGDETRTISLPEDVVSRVEDRLPRTEFDTASDYVAFVLGTVLHDVENETDVTGSDGGNDVEITRRLRHLGYLDE